MVGCGAGDMGQEDIKTSRWTKNKVIWGYVVMLLIWWHIPCKRLWPHVLTRSQVRDFDPSCQLLVPFFSYMDYLFKMDIVLLTELHRALHTVDHTHGELRSRKGTNLFKMMQPLSGPDTGSQIPLQLRTQLSSCSTCEPVMTPFIETSMDIVDILRRKSPGLPDLRMVTEGWSGSEKKAWAGHKRNGCGQIWTQFKIH